MVGGLDGSLSSIYNAFGMIDLPLLGVRWIDWSLLGRGKRLDARKGS